jgi:hypothetical protein
MDKGCIFIYLPPLWSSGQTSWLQIQRRYQTFWEVVGLERGPLSLVSTFEELLESESSGSGLENWEYGRKDQLLWPRDTLYSQKLALNTPTSGCRSVGIVRTRTQATEFIYLFIYSCHFSVKGRGIAHVTLQWDRVLSRMTCVLPLMDRQARQDWCVYACLHDMCRFAGDL